MSCNCGKSCKCSNERDDLIKEHERLIRRLKSGTHLDEEAKEQEKDLDDLKSGNSLERFINKMDDEEKDHMITLIRRSKDTEEKEERPDLSRVKRPSKLYVKKHEKDGGNYLI